MAQLAYDVRNYLAQQKDLTDLLASSPNWGTWIYADKPLGKIENTGKALVVISENGSSDSSNSHNTLAFPRLYVDVWADPTRNPDGSVRQQDADIKIGKIHKLLSKYLHLVDNGTRQGMPICWGNQAQMLTYTGSLINSSQRDGEPTYYDVADGNGARMGSVTYSVSVF